MKRILTVICTAVFFLVGFSIAESAEIRTSAFGGDWSSPSSWEGNTVPGPGDTVIINSDVSLDQSVTVGTGSGTAVTIGVFGSFTIENGRSLTVRGNIESSGNIVMEAGSSLLMDTAAASIIKLNPGDPNSQGEDYPFLQINGTAASHCRVQAIGQGHTRITDHLSGGGIINPGGGRVVATYCDFSRLGGAPDYSAITYAPLASGHPFSFENCTFDQCSRIRPNLNLGIPAGADVRFVNCRWTRSVVDPGQSGEWAVFEAWSQYDATLKVKGCDFDTRAGLFRSWDAEIEDCVFRQGVLLSMQNGHWKSFKNNFMAWYVDSNIFTMPYGNSVENSVFIIDHPFSSNPHFVSLSGGSGPVTFRGNIFWYPQTPVSSAGDGISIGTPTGGSRSTNTILIENNIFLPNGNGPDGDDNISASGFTTITNSPLRSIYFNRNTLFVSGGVSNGAPGVGGLVIGESHQSPPGDVASVKSNLFVGSRNNPTGKKIHNFNSNTVVDIFLAENVDYNGSNYVAYGEAYAKNHASGKGYGDFDFSGNEIIGAHDVDEEDPQFVDPYRTPATWTTGGTLEDTMNLLSPGGGKSMKDLLSYLRAGFMPRNQKFAHAGDPAAGRPDIGAVDMTGAILNYMPAIISSTKKRRR